MRRLCGMSSYKEDQWKPGGAMYAWERGLTSPIERVEIPVNMTPNYQPKQGQYKVIEIVGGLWYMGNTLKKGTKIIIQRPAAEISGDHHTYANNPFEKITDINKSPKMYLPRSALKPLKPTRKDITGGVPESSK
jgi:hypothetical protein